jgi:16S rRNA (guanine1207-N2)-methyltransferase
MDIAANERVLDLGCGSGVIGAVAAVLAPGGHAHLLDADCEAVRSAQETISINQLSNCTVVASDCGEELRGVSFDVVATNPPFHLGHKAELGVAHQFIRDSASLLQPKGRLILVANRTIAYEKTIERWFGHIRTIHKDTRYKVLLCEDPYKE